MEVGFSAESLVGLPVHWYTSDHIQESLS